MPSTVNRFFRPAFLPLLVALLLIGGIAAAQGVPTRPNQPTVAATANAGELRVSWNPTSDTQFYTVGWLNNNEYLDAQSSGRDWQDAFHYATIPASYTAHTVTGLKSGEAYYVIVGARTVRFGGDDPVWSPWSNLVTTAGQHGEGFCPITGLPLPPGGYLSVGQSAVDVSGARFTLTSVARKASIKLGDEFYRAITGRQFVSVCGTYHNSADSEYLFLFGMDYNVSADAGVGFAVPDASLTGWLDVGRIPAGGTRRACDVWEIPGSADTVIIAFNNFQANPALFRVDLP